MKAGEFIFDSTGAGAEFLKVEAQAGLTRARIAEAATSQNKRERNRVEARKAYDAILHFLPQTPLSGEDKKQLESRLIELRFALQPLGDDV